MRPVLAFEKTKWLEFTKVKWAAPKISSGPKRDQTRIQVHVPKLQMMAI